MAAVPQGHDAMSPRTRRAAYFALWLSLILLGAGAVFATGYIVALADTPGPAPWSAPPTVLPAEPSKDDGPEGVLQPERLQVQQAPWACRSRDQAIFVRPRAAERELRGYSWRCALLRRANFAGVHLVDVAMDGATMRQINFAEAHLEDVTGDGAQMQRSRWTRARLQNVSLAGAQLRRSTWVGAELSGVSLAGADLRGADFCGVRGMTAQTITGTRVAGMRCPDGEIVPRMTFGRSYQCTNVESPIAPEQCQGAHEQVRR